MGIIERVRRDPSQFIATTERRIGVILGLGVVCRLAQYLADRPFWMDEGSLAVNVREKSLVALFGPLLNEQLAPPGFLVVSWIAARILGDNPLALRLFPLACGIAALGLFTVVARRCLGGRAVGIAIALFAISDDLIYYSSEFKPYSSDVALALACTLMGLDIASKGLTIPRAVAFGTFGAVVAWFSYPCLFVLAGLGVVLLVSAMARGDWGRGKLLVLLGLLWAGSYAAVYAVSLDQLGHRRSMWAFWNFAFPPLPPQSVRDATWALRRLAYLFVNPLNFNTPLGPTLSALVPLGLFLVGGASLAGRDGRCFGMLTLPGGFALLASFLRLYPFHGRLILFLVPYLLLLIAEGAGVVREKVGRGVLWVIVLGALFLFPSLEAVFHVLEPRRTREFNPHGDLRPERFEPERFPFPIGEGAGLSPW